MFAEYDIILTLLGSQPLPKLCLSPLSVLLLSSILNSTSLILNIRMLKATYQIEDDVGIAVFITVVTAAVVENTKLM